MESRDKGKRREDECSRCERRNVDGLPREADLTPKLRSVECSDLYFRIQGGMIYFATGISDEKGQTVDFFCESEGDGEIYLRVFVFFPFMAAISIR
jgi:hypothetical protein